MGRKIYLTEEQLARLLLMNNQSLNEGVKDFLKGGNLKERIKFLLKKGVAIAVIVSALVQAHNLGFNEANGVVGEIEEQLSNSLKQEDKWELIADDVIATVYNAEPKQCNNDVTHTASMFRLNLSDVLSHKIIAMERTMMKEFGLKYGDVVKIEGTGKWDGEWQIQDTMNKRFAGQHKIDILIPKSEGLGKWNNVKVYKLNNPEEKDNIKSEMAPQLSKKQAQAQIERIKNGTFAIV
jgi:hypothetical protein